MDFNLHGMGHIKLSRALFRPPLSPTVAADASDDPWNALSFRLAYEEEPSGAVTT